MKNTFSKTELKELVDLVLETWHVPGLALAVVQDGQTTWCEGYGARQINMNLPVTPDTLFPIASCTKGFTTAAMAWLVEAGRLDWDRPVREYLPDFKLWDVFATERMTPRDLASHRSGLPGHDMLWYASNFRQGEIFERLRYLEPSRDLRCAFQYNNLMFIVCGMLIEKVSGESWEHFIQTCFLDPLEMGHSVCSCDAIHPSSDHALPYFYRDGVTREMPFQKQIALAPAGGICSCASDMARWLEFQLNLPTTREKPILSAASLEQMHSPQIFIDDPQARKRYGHEFSSYGLGWGLRSHRGHFLVEHDGMADGFYALAAMLPRHGIGIVALSNCDAYYNPVQSNLVPNIICYSLFDQLLGLEPFDWNGLMKAAYDQASDEFIQYKEQLAAEPAMEAPEAHPMQAYLGDYIHPGYGMLSIRQSNGKLDIVFNDKLALPMTHCYGDTFAVYFELTGMSQKIVFFSDPLGNITQVACPLVPGIQDITYTRRQVAAS